jgi:hypothetical protein
MICPTCHDQGFIDAGYSIHLGQNKWIRRMQLCPSCLGGIASCCDAAGSQQPEPESEEKG